MKKFMRIALVFALAGATLMYTGCTKDYSGDISDLNKKVSEQASALSALQTQVAAAQSSASEALSSAQNALKEAQAAAKAAADANNDAEVAALTTKIATIEGNIADLQAKVEALNGLEAKLNEVADQLKKDVDAKVDAALEEIQKELDKALAQIDGAFTIKSANQLDNTVTYKWAKWAPSKKAGEQKLFAKLAEAFPELKDIKKDEVVASCNDVPFIVTPSTMEFDETDSFALVDIDGEDLGWELGAPYASPANVKAGTAGVWFVDVQKPAYEKDGKTFKVNTEEKPLALVVEKANGAIAQTAFDYNVTVKNVTVGPDPAYTINDVDCDADKFEDGAFDLNLKLVEDFNGRLPYAEYFIIEPTSKLEIEKYGVSVDGATITVGDLPEKGEPAIDIKFQKTVIFLDGRTAQAAFKVHISAGAIAPNAELADSTIAVTLGYNAKASTGQYNVNVDIARGFGLNEVEWEAVYNALNKAQTGAGTTLSAEYLDDDTDNKYTGENDNKIFAGQKVTFLKKDGKTPAEASDEVAYIRFTINSQNAKPGKYSVKITDGSVFCAVGTIDVKNPAVKPVKIADKLCEDGVLQIVGTPANDAITYDLTQALILTTGAVGTTFTFTDVAYEAATEETSDQTVEENWITGTAKKMFSIPTWNAKWDASAYTHNNKKAQKLLNTKREFAVTFNWFDDGNDNPDTLHFWAQAVSPIWTADGSNITLNTDAAKGGVRNEIYYVKEWDAAGKPTKFDETAFTGTQVTGGTYVAGTKKGTKFEVKGGKNGTNIEWKKDKKENTAYDLTSAATEIVSAIVPNTNLTSGKFVLGPDNKFVVITLEQLLAMGEISAADYAVNSANEDYKAYVSEDLWIKIRNAWTTYYKIDLKYGGKFAPVTINKEDTDPDTIDDAFDDAEEAIEALAESDQAKINYFETLFGQIKFTKRMTESYSTAAYSGDVPASVPNEFDGMPFFTFEGDEADYDTYATIDYNTTTKVVTTITAKTDNPAGRKTVVIPVYANVKDKWGMTTQKKVDITLKVNE